MGLVLQWLEVGTAMLLSGVVISALKTGVVCKKCGEPFFSASVFSYWPFLPFFGWLSITVLFVLVVVGCEVKERLLRTKTNGYAKVD